MLRGKHKYRYIIAVIAPITIVSLRLLFLENLGTKVPYVMFYPVVVFSALYGGIGPAILSTCIAALCVDYFWIEPQGYFANNSYIDWLGIALFIVNSLLVSWIIERMHKIQERTTLAEAELRFLSERKRADEALRQANDYLEKLFDYANAPIICWDANFKITRFNHAFERLTDYPAAEVLGHDLSMLFPEQRRDESLNQIRRTLAGEHWEVVEIPILRKDGDIRIALWNSANVYADDGKTLLATIAQGQDITVRKRIAEALREANAELEQRVEQRTEELIRAQSELIEKKRLSDIGTLSATVAHELRNPLAAIKMAAYNIKRKANNPYLDKHISNIDAKVVESEQIIDNLLFYSRLRMSSFEKTDIYEVLNECVNSASERFIKTGVSLEKDIGSIRGLVLEIDALQIKEVFNNILNNAFDAFYGRKGRIMVVSSVGNNAVTIAINDNGEGIETEYLDKIYDPFFTTKAKGTGLGLAVCSQFMRMHNGKIHIESAKGKGTTVTLTIPMTQK